MVHTGFTETDSHFQVKEVVLNTIDSRHFTMYIIKRFITVFAV